MKFDTEGAHNMLHNLSRMIDERAECAVRADYDREMDAVRNGEGVETVNKRVAGAVIGGMASSRSVFGVAAAGAASPSARARARPRREGAPGRGGGRPARGGGPAAARRVVDLAAAVGPLNVAAMGGHRGRECADAAGATVDLAGEGPRR